MMLFQSGRAGKARPSLAAPRSRRLRPAYLGIGLVYLYLYTLGVLFPGGCKYHPSCSQYAIDALRRYGLLRGVILAAWAIAFVEYCFAVPANRYGNAVYTAAQLKTIQEVITLLVFAGFSLVYLKEPIG